MRMTAVDALEDEWIKVAHENIISQLHKDEV